ncbi:serine O-acetyltransferase [Aquimarina sp. I32.4]|uniref:serine O-acetyltransferase n=1 Tax=Aquimarina sp. I32.4 TaxID=2053903 RepID=UPI0011AF2D5E|nr:serine acetyltransferase [Aquimarina sp. I32.4]
MRSLLLSVYKIFLLPHILLYKRSNNKSDIDKDIDRWALAKNMKGGNVSLLLTFLAYSPDFRSIFYFRTRSLLSHVLNIYCRKEKYFRIDINTKLGGGVLTGHPYSTILNANSIGENFYVNHLVTIGEIDGKKPTIGDNVSVNTGAIIIGDINVGNNSIIGAGAVVVKDVPDNSVVVGNPARVIKKDGKRVRV